jgi:hypothetical protein
MSVPLIPSEDSTNWVPEKFRDRWGLVARRRANAARRSGGRLFL